MKDTMKPNIFLIYQYARPFVNNCSHNCSVNPTCFMENDVKGFRLTRFSFNEI